jgi:hypothetical protein
MGPMGGIGVGKASGTALIKGSGRGGQGCLHRGSVDALTGGRDRIQGESVSI